MKIKLNPATPAILVETSPETPETFDLLGLTRNQMLAFRAMLAGCSGNVYYHEEKGGYGMGDIRDTFVAMGFRWEEAVKLLDSSSKTGSLRLTVTK